MLTRLRRPAFRQEHDRASVKRTPAVLGVVATAVMVFAAACALDESVPGPERRAQQLNSVIMCPVCPGESIDQSQNPLALQMRDLVAEKIDQGWTDGQIKDFFVERYDPSVLLEPPTEGFALTVWMIPPVAVLAAALALLFALRVMRRRPAGAGGHGHRTAPGIRPGRRVLLPAYQGVDRPGRVGDAMIVDTGQTALIIALVVAGYAVLGSFLGGWLRMPELTLSARYGLYTVPALLLISSLALVYAFVTNDFSVRYVAENSNLAMPQVYTWVAMYAGNAGSLLFIALVFSLLAVLAALSMRRRLPQTTPYSVGTMALVITFFLGIMVSLANPLERLPVTPPDGQGINPLLLHFGMFIHPPMQMTGLVAVAIPFSIAIGALLANRGGQDEWVDLGRLWGMVAWVILTIGLLLGAWWAYTILGWGGYWAWDPVENSALMPWLAVTAFVHSIMVQKRRGMFRMWNMVLIIVGFTLAQMGMFINRGGPVPSVHSFAQSTMGWLFLFFMAATVVGARGDIPVAPGLTQEPGAPRIDAVA